MHSIFFKNNPLDLNVQTHKCNAKVSKLRWRSLLSLSYVPLKHLMKSHGCPLQGCEDAIFGLPFSARQDEMIMVFLGLSLVFLLVENAKSVASVTHVPAGGSSSRPQNRVYRTPFSHHHPHVSLMHPSS